MSPTFALSTFFGHSLPKIIKKRFLRILLTLLLTTSAILLSSGCTTITYKPYRGYKYSPYTIRGTRYYPMRPREALGYEETGIASYYIGGTFWRHGLSALGERLGPRTRAAAHKTLPLPCVIRVTNLQNGRSTTVRVNDRGPFIKGRMLDVTVPVAKELGFYHRGLAPVHIRVLSVGDGRYRIH
ncbi:MAG: septal ring lytic transglycosylase RlpA family protein [Chthoniobacterales bacterium]|nr:septal ring lytic transglycosylase RlpA family protein [Chthoniobacterales bacterium]MCX7713091.1 septal ring lytic transglycosylase RlpA family protein [Chthoniobacterales bacterium]